jgi:adenylate cyclase
MKAPGRVEVRVGLLVTLVTVALYLLASRSPVLTGLEARALDARFRLRGVVPPGGEIVLVLIDDRSIAELGRWPWTRSRFAELLSRLRAAGARVVAFDLLFTEPERRGDLEALRALRAALESAGFADGDARLATLRRTLARLEEAADADRILASAVGAGGNVVLPLVFALDPPPDDRPAPGGAPAFVARSAYRIVRGPGSSPGGTPPAAAALTAPLEVIGERARALGHVTVTFDSDGAPRYEHPVVEYGAAYYPSLPVQAAREYLGVPPDGVEVVLGAGIRLGDLGVPTDESMGMVVNYRGPRGLFPAHSLADVVAGRVDPAAFAGKLVLVGAAATGLGDTFLTPFSPDLPGVERHAHVIESILRQDFLLRRRTTALLDLAFVVGFGVLLALTNRRAHPVRGVLLALALAAVCVAANVLAFTRAGVWINLLFPLGGLVAAQAAITFSQVLTEKRLKRRIREAFARYLHPALVDEIAANPQLCKLGGEARELTVLFCDIRGFSAMAERLPPEQLVALLNSYFDAMATVVLDHRGLLDKYIGDAVLAVYGAPLPSPDHAYDACCTALAMVARLDAVQGEWSAKGLPRIGIGIGIVTGRMVVGNVGSRRRFDYTVIGDGVNLASRLEGVNKTYGTSILTSESTWERVRDRVAMRELDIVQVKGKQAPTRIFEVLGLHPLPDDQARRAAEFERGLVAYRGRRWAEAIAVFGGLLEKAPEDGPARLYLDRAREFLETPPPPDWDAVHVMETK